MSRAILHCGDAVAVLWTLPAESVRCVVTSPPYWGLRDYGLPATVYGGDPACEHDWGEEGIKVRGGGNGAATIGRDQSARASRVPTGAFCLRCGAWRGALGLEPTPDLYIEHMVEIFREVRRLLTKDGTLWLNMGDCYATGAGRVGEHPGGGEQGARWKGDVNRLRDAKRGYRGDRLVNTNSGDIKRPETGRGVHTPENAGKAAGRVAAMGPMTQPNRMPIAGLKPKDLVMMPARLALALQADGWYLRSQIIWAKPNPMPESVRDRPTTSHEYVFLLTRSERYFYDADAIREKWESGRDDMRSKGVRTGTAYLSQEHVPSNHRKPDPRSSWKTPDGWDTSTGEGGHGSFHKQGREKGKRRSGNKQRDDGAGRNARTVWTMPSQPYKGAHFATFPEELARRCILAGTSARGRCPECGNPWVRVTETTYRNDTTTDGRPAQGNSTKHGAKQAGQRTFASGERTRRIDRTTGWKSTCEHEHESVPDVVLDPFGGSGTVAQVATGNARDSIYIDLNPEYLELARQRIGPMLCEVV